MPIGIAAQDAQSFTDKEFATFQTLMHMWLKKTARVQADERDLIAKIESRMERPEGERPTAEQQAANIADVQADYAYQFNKLMELYPNLTMVQQVLEAEENVHPLLID